MSDFKARFIMNFIKNEMSPVGLIPVTETSHFLC